MRYKICKKEKETAGISRYIPNKRLSISQDVFFKHLDIIADKNNKLT
jgi:hypothetical protein